MSVSDWRIRTPGLPDLCGRRARWRLSPYPAAALDVRIRRACALVAAFAVARSLESLPTTYFATGSGGVVVLDLSTSVDVQKAQRAQRVLRSLVETEGASASSSSPTARTRCCRRTRAASSSSRSSRSSVPGRRSRPTTSVARAADALCPTLPRDRPRESPWSLDVPRRHAHLDRVSSRRAAIIEREGDRNLSVLLISDLDNSGFDTSPLTEELGRYEQAGIDLKVIPLFPGQGRGPLRAAGREGRARCAAGASSQHRRGGATDDHRGVSWVLAAVGGALLLFLAANERLCGRLTWGAPR